MGAAVKNDYNNVLGATILSVHLPVIESNGDTSGVVVGIPDPSNSGLYLVFYQHNALLSKNSNGYYYGELGFNLFNIGTNGYFVSDTLPTAPRWINNPRSAGFFYSLNTQNYYQKLLCTEEK